MGLFSRNSKKKLDWKEINSLNELQNAIDSSKDKIGVFFKHSTRCSISKMVLNRFENQWEENGNFNLYFIDLLSHRDVSDRLATITEIAHQSPQAIALKDGKVLYNKSHNGISAKNIIELI